LHERRQAKSIERLHGYIQGRMTRIEIDIDTLPRAFGPDGRGAV
jgi:hypothetical protein